MKTRKKIVSILLVFMLLISLMPTALAAESSYQDTSGHWAEAAIERWSDYGIIQGSNGSFSPNGSLTRAHMAAILSRLLNLPEAPNAGFSDVKDGDWHADYINRCAAAGIMLGYNGKANPNAPITRQDAIVMMARALGIKPVENPDLSHFQDGSKVSDYAKGYVAAMNKDGIVGGVTTDTLAGGSDITRAATVTILNRAITTYANEPGATVTATGSGIVLIAADNVTVTGKADSVLVSEGVASGNVTLKDVTVAGTVTVKAEDVSMAVAGKSSIGEVNVAAEAAGTSIAVEKNATVSTVTTEAPKTSLDVSGKVGSVTVSDTADSTSIKANSGATISSVDNAADGITVSGTGKVENVTTSGNNAAINTPGTKVEAAEGTTGTTAGGKDVAGGSSITTKPSTPSGGGGGGSTTPSHSHSYATAWSNDADYHWHACTCGAVSDKAAHSWDEGVDGQAATCTEDGVKTYTCTVCGQTKIETIAAGHTMTKTDAKEATCTEAGNTAYWTCSKCGKYFSDAAGGTEIEANSWAIEATGHAMTEADAKEATCTVAGNTAYWTCTKCGKYFSDAAGKTEIQENSWVIKATGHNWREARWDAAQKDNNTCTVCGETMDEALKFYFGVTSNSAVEMVVFDDYSFTVTVPNGTVDAAQVTALVRMQNVGSLGVGEARQHSMTVNTGIEGHNAVPLQNWLSNAWTFGAECEDRNATVNIYVADNDCTYQDCTYQIFNVGVAGEGNEDATIWGIPEDVEATRAAWQELAAHVTTTGGLEDDSYILIKNGSYLQNGAEKLCFEETYKDGENPKDLKLDNFSDLAALKQTVKDAVKLETVEGDSIEACLKAGTELKISSSSAVLADDVTITVENTVITTNTGDNALTAIRTAANTEGNFALAEALVQLVNGLMGSVQGQKINVRVAFD